MSTLKSVCSALAALATLGLSDARLAQALPFDAAVATYEQALPGGPWAASYAIDGNTSGVWNFAQANGWGVYNLVTEPAVPTVDYTESQTAYFRLTHPISANSVAGIQIGMYFNFEPYPYHSLGSFRISLSTADLHAAPFTLANAQAAAWTSFAPLSFAITPSSGPAPTYTVEGGNVLLVTGPTPPQSLYTLTIAPGDMNVTGIRLEALSHAGLPFNGPGLAPEDGNFTLNEITAQSTPVPEPASVCLLMPVLAALLMRLHRRI